MGYVQFKYLVFTRMPSCVEFMYLVFTRMPRCVEFMYLVFTRMPGCVEFVPGMTFCFIPNINNVLTYNILMYLGLKQDVRCVSPRQNYFHL